MFNKNCDVEEQVYTNANNQKKSKANKSIILFEIIVFAIIFTIVLLMIYGSEFIKSSYGEKGTTIIINIHIITFICLLIPGLILNLNNIIKKRNFRKNLICLIIVVIGIVTLVYAIIKY